MLHIFSLPTNFSLAEKIRQLHDSQLSSIFGRTILNRAYDYLDAIESLEIQPGRAEAEILGSERYEVVIEHRAGDVFGDGNADPCEIVVGGSNSTTGSCNSKNFL